MGLETTSINKIKQSDIQKKTIAETILPQNSETTDFAYKIDDKVLEQLGISRKEYISIAAQTPEFVTWSKEEQLAYIQIMNAPEDTSTPDEDVDDTGNENIYFNHEEFSHKTNDKKFQIYSEEYAKNKFLYGNDDKNSVEAWNDLPNDQKQKLINEAKNNIVKPGSEGKFNDKDISMSLQYEMTQLQAANKKGMTLDSFKTLDSDKRQEFVHDYLFSLPNGEDGTKNYLSDNQKKYFEDQEFKSTALVAYCRKNGEDWGKGDYVLSSSELQQHCKRLGVNIIDIQKDYLTDLKNSERGLTPDETKKLEGLTKLSNLLEAVENNHDKDFGRMDIFMESEFGELYSAAQTPEDKTAIAMKYAKKTFGELPKEERTKAFSEFVSDMVHSDAELAAKFHEQFVMGASHEEQEALVASEVGYSKELNSYNSNAFELEHRAKIAENNKKLTKTDPKRAERCAHLQLDGADNQTLRVTSDIYSNYGIESVEQKHDEIAFDKTRVDAETQNVMGTNIFRSDNTERKIKAGVKIDTAYDENQIYLQSIAIKTKEVNDAMVEDGTFTRFASENRVDALKMHKARFEESDYDKDSAVNGLNRLSDWVTSDAMKNDPDAQLAMHNEMMTSKYSEVQEHVANNIQYYDKSVQAKAIESVYESGNQKAIEKAVTNLVTSKDQTDASKGVLAETKIKQTIIGAYSDDKYVSDLAERIRSGQSLTPAEYSSLSAVEKSKYKMACFKALPAGKQIEVLTQITDKNMKKAIYKQIASTNKAFLKRLIENDAETAKFIYENTDAKELVLQIAEFKGPSSIAYATIVQKYGHSEQNENDYNDTNSNYATLPDGFNNDKFDIFPKKNGNLIT